MIKGEEGGEGGVAALAVTVLVQASRVAAVIEVAIVVDTRNDTVTEVAIREIEIENATVVDTEAGGVVSVHRTSKLIATEKLVVEEVEAQVDFETDPTIVVDDNLKDTIVTTEDSMGEIIAKSGVGAQILVHDLTNEGEMVILATEDVEMG
mmetsp:Transcript_7415/g.9699  ORF Transcript_7415/g.9699 Transcript_7415/m.9699 type:complete len:151 (+) Transcript_7415:24-476(+)